MEAFQGKTIETDFKKWFIFSDAIDSREKTKCLKKVVEKKKSYKGLRLKKEKSDSEVIYFLTEENNTSILRLDQSSCKEFLTYLKIHFFPEPVLEQSLLNKYSTKDYNKKKDEVGWLFEKLSTENKMMHGLNFSLFSLLICQVYILPGNLDIVDYGDWANYFFFGIIIFVWYLSIWSYSKLIGEIKSYWDIFKLSASYHSFFFLFAAFEIIIFTLIDSEVNIWFFSGLIIFLQSAALIMTPFLSMIMYFIKGGKIIKVN